MATKEYAGSSVDVNDEGYMTDHSQWTEEIAKAIAAEEGVGLTDDHWNVIKVLHEQMNLKGQLPTIRGLKKLGIETKKLYELFPDGPVKKASRIAGYLKPASCV
ncbi:MAG: TusE/DsrC/DsvC family sulfur relay protein [Spirochaetales bacterium]|nr:MAG: TusE/DsrC/DsvC family sulfur relay protein [Spirochaetales bacterium]